MLVLVSCATQRMTEKESSKAPCCIVKLKNGAESNTIDGQEFTAHDHASTIIETLAFMEGKEERDYINPSDPQHPVQSICKCESDTCLMGIRERVAGEPLRRA